MGFLSVVWNCWVFLHRFQQPPMNLKMSVSLMMATTKACMEQGFWKTTLQKPGLASIAPRQECNSERRIHKQWGKSWCSSFPRQNCMLHSYSCKTYHCFCGRTARLKPDTPNLLKQWNPPGSKKARLVARQASTQRCSIWGMELSCCKLTSSSNKTWSPKHYCHGRTETPSRGRVTLVQDTCLTKISLLWALEDWLQQKIIPYSTLPVDYSKMSQASTIGLVFLQRMMFTISQDRPMPFHLRLRCSPKAPRREKRTWHLLIESTEQPTHLTAGKKM